MAPKHELCNRVRKFAFAVYLTLVEAQEPLGAIQRGEEIKTLFSQYAKTCGATARTAIAGGATRNLVSRHANNQIWRQGCRCSHAEVAKDSSTWSATAAALAASSPSSMWPAVCLELDRFVLACQTIPVEAQNDDLEGALVWHMPMWELRTLRAHEGRHHCKQAHF